MNRVWLPAVFQPLPHAGGETSEADAHVESFEDVLWVDEHVVDGAVNGMGSASTAGGRALRVLQSGYVRNYALGIGIGAVLLLGWFVSRGVF